MDLKKTKITKNSAYKELFINSDKTVGKYFVILYKSTEIEDDEIVNFRFGITASKKIGNAVKRNNDKLLVIFGWDFHKSYEEKEIVNFLKEHDIDYIEESIHTWTTRHNFVNKDKTNNLHPPQEGHKAFTEDVLIRKLNKLKWAEEADRVHQKLSIIPRERLIVQIALSQERRGAGKSTEQRKKRHHQAQVSQHEVSYLTKFNTTLFLSGFAKAKHGRRVRWYTCVQAKR